MKLINSDNGKVQTGAHIQDGKITPFTNVDLTDFMADLKDYKECYDKSKAKNMHHIARFEANVIENIRILKGYPANQEGFNLAVKEAVRMVKSGELRAFAVHDA